MSFGTKFPLHNIGTFSIYVWNPVKAPTIYERGQGLGFGYKWLAGLVSRVCMAGLDSRVGINMAQWTDQGEHNFGETIISALSPDPTLEEGKWSGELWLNPRFLLYGMR